MPRLSSEQRRSYWDAAVSYRDQFSQSPEAAEYLERRGLARAATKFSLGCVVDPRPGHEAYRGMLAIPYLRQSSKGKWSAISLRFRCIACEGDHQGHGKYMSPPGDQPHVYNTMAMLTAEDRVAICEGEMDAMTATLAGVPAVGIPGATNWQSHYRPMFAGYEQVTVLADGDDAGRTFARTVAKSLGNARVLSMPPGEDVNSYVQANGADALREWVER